MEIGKEKCNSCGTPLKERGFTTFKCPSCSNEYIGRCNQCRNNSVEYVCPSCKFRGP
ncbi:MAG: zinc finger domain-containing protein [Candidatus Thermoplasmatota archaeon]|nr:zinc finger domain-containing protein [Candidatus Thermoplasmatota archaeon]MCL5964040.1 zinc finger domain-containing protein [Candidatus Thermoplasmatota archaeon]